jgi:hypothetical protein
VLIASAPCPDSSTPPDVGTTNGTVLRPELKICVPGHRHHRRDLLARVLRDELVREAPAPAAAHDVARQQALPQHLLVGVREQVRRAHRAGLVLRHVDRREQRAGVGDDASLPGRRAPSGSARLGWNPNDLPPWRAAVNLRISACVSATCEAGVRTSPYCA